MKVIDSHHHLWQYSPIDYPWMAGKAVLQVDQLIPELQCVASANGIDGFVTVQARQSVEETDWLLQLGEQSNLIMAVVGWLPLRDLKTLGSTIERFRNSKKLKGVRHVIQDEPDDDFILGPTFNQGVSALAHTGWVYDILIYARHLRNAIPFVDSHPNQLFVLDHIAKPTIVAGKIDQGWLDDIRELSKRDHVTCKFSGVATEIRDATWDIATIEPYWNTIFESFGSSRVMFGSDWPVCLLRTSYADWKWAVGQLAKQLSPAEQLAFWSENAIRAYSIDCQ